MSTYTQEEIDAMPVGAKVSAAAAMRSQGVRTEEIARIFGVTTRTVYNWFAQYRDEYIQELESQKHIDVFTEQLQFLQEYEQRVQRVAARMGYDPDIQVDKNSKIKGKLADWVNLMKLAAQIREQQVRLHQFVGTLPKQPERIHHTISDLSSKTGENKDDISKLTRDDLEKMTLKRLQEQLIL